MQQLLYAGASTEAAAPDVAQICAWQPLRGQSQMVRLPLVVGTIAEATIHISHAILTAVVGQEQAGIMGVLLVAGPA